ncbi:MAG TPA: tetratricopeptide repeat protein [Povalibacter sp.]|nr:tetratricopeptide repeat protein [Povalibacter sp.]
MVDELLSDDEREEALLQWWRENWRWILAGIVVGIGMLVGWRYWQGYRVQRAEHAAQLYNEAQTALNGNDLGKAEAALKQLQTSFDSTAYTQQAQLLLAKAQVEAGEFAKAEPLLRSVADKSKDKELADIAQLRLARLLVQQGKHDEAVQLLQPLTTGGFGAQAHEIRGDALVAKGDAQGARAEYAAALAATDAQLDRALVELKLQDVGGSAPAANSQGQL